MLLHSYCFWIYVYCAAFWHNKCNNKLILLIIIRLSYVGSVVRVFSFPVTLVMGGHPACKIFMSHKCWSCIYVRVKWVLQQIVDCWCAFSCSSTFLWIVVSVTEWRSLSSGLISLFYVVAKYLCKIIQYHIHYQYFSVFNLFIGVYIIPMLSGRFYKLGAVGLLYTIWGEWKWRQKIVQILVHNY